MRELDHPHCPAFGKAINVDDASLTLRDAESLSEGRNEPSESFYSLMHPEPKPENMCLNLPSLSRPTTYLSRLHESYEYSRDRRKMREQFEAYHAPPESRNEKINRYHQQHDTGGGRQEFGEGTRNTILRSLSRRKSKKEEVDVLESSDSRARLFRGGGGLSSSSAEEDDFARPGESVSASSAWRSDSWSPSRGRVRQIQKPRGAWGSVSAEENDAYNSEMDPWGQSDDPWLLPPLKDVAWRR